MTTARYVVQKHKPCTCCPGSPWYTIPGTETAEVWRGENIARGLAFVNMPDRYRVLELHTGKVAWAGGYDITARDLDGRVCRFRAREGV